MKQFSFSLNTLLQVKSHIFEKDVMALATLQKKLHQLEKRHEELQNLFDEIIESSIAIPVLSKNVTGIQEKLTLLEEEIDRERKKMALCQKSVSDSLHKRKVVEKIKERKYALYQKEYARINEKNHHL